MIILCRDFWESTQLFSVPDDFYLFLVISSTVKAVLVAIV